MRSQRQHKWNPKIVIVSADAKQVRAQADAPRDECKNRSVNTLDLASGIWATASPCLAHFTVGGSLLTSRLAGSLTFRICFGASSADDV
jgi:hypothetical protein